MLVYHKSSFILPPNGGWYADVPVRILRNIQKGNDFSMTDPINAR